MPAGQRRGRAAVPEPAGQHRRPPAGLGVPHLGRRVVAHPPAGRDHPPDQVHVLAVTQIRVEPAAGRLPPDQQGRGGHEGQPGQGRDLRFAAAHIDRPPGVQVAADRVRAGQRAHPRRDRAHQRVGEVRGELGDPPRVRRAVAVDERDQRRGDQGQPVVAGLPGSAGRRAPAQPGAVPGADPGHGGRVARAVVHHDHRVAAAERREAPVEPGGPVPDRDHHGGVGPLPCGRRPRVGQPRVGEAAGQPAVLR